MRDAWREIKQSRTFDEFYFLAIALILAFGTLQSAGTVMDTEQPVVSVVSCSMYPELHVGDILLVKGTDFEDIGKGDVIVFSTPESEIPVVHRVIEKNQNHVETKGDNNPRQLEWEDNVMKDQIHGKMFFRIPRVGGLKLLAMDITGLNGRPLAIDSYPACSINVPLDQRTYG